LRTQFFHSLVNVQPVQRGKEERKAERSTRPFPDRRQRKKKEKKKAPSYRCRIPICGFNLALKRGRTQKSESEASTSQTREGQGEGKGKTRPPASSNEPWGGKSAEPSYSAAEGGGKKEGAKIAPSVSLIVVLTKVGHHLHPEEKKKRGGGEARGFPLLLTQLNPTAPKKGKWEALDRRTASWGKEKEGSFLYREEKGQTTAPRKGKKGKKKEGGTVLGGLSPLTVRVPARERNRGRTVCAKERVVPGSLLSFLNPVPTKNRRGEGEKKVRLVVGYEGKGRGGKDLLPHFPRRGGERVRGAYPTPRRK